TEIWFFSKPIFSACPACSVVDLFKPPARALGLRRFLPLRVARGALKDEPRSTRSTRRFGFFPNRFSPRARRAPWLIFSSTPAGALGLRRFLRLRVARGALKDEPRSTRSTRRFGFF